MKTLKCNLIVALMLCTTIIVPSIGFAASIPTQGDWTTTLQPRYIGDTTTPNAYYDTSLGITWLADANAAAGSAYDTRVPGTGLMSWATATTWATNLSINGVTGWSMPTMTDPSANCNSFTYSDGPCGYNNPSTSEMAHLFYTTLGNTGGLDTSGNPEPVYGLTNTGPFSNAMSGIYWSGTDYAPDTSNAWSFSTTVGAQSAYAKNVLLNYVWAVHAGDVGSASPVPVPATMWLFGSGLLGLLGAALRKAA